MASIKQNVLDVIAERHTTKAAVERAAGLANGTINAWSDKSEPRKTTLEQIAAVLGVNVNVFYGAPLATALHIMLRPQGCRRASRGTLSAQ